MVFRKTTSASGYFVSMVKKRMSILFTSPPPQTASSGYSPPAPWRMFRGCLVSLKRTQSKRDSPGFWWQSASSTRRCGVGSPSYYSFRWLSPCHGRL